MSELSPIEPDAEEEWEVGWDIREATHADVPAAAAAINQLLEELGGKAGDLEELERVAHALVDDGSAGVLLVAENLNEIVGVLGVSWQIAIRIPGRYGLIQEMWVHPAFRGMTMGGDLVVALFDIARRQGVRRLEVGLPAEHYPHLDATEAFYVNNGFTTIGTRMRRLL
ncbi:MAG TPA: GNAT family N-acetyltransferase [Solirubrobacteraceae bacterium]|nr:GNAT family N-acetyltransferase [Solirubrobacteraceae bacterium]